MAAPQPPQAVVTPQPQSQNTPEPKPKKKINISEEERQRRRENMMKIRMNRILPKAEILEEYTEPPKPTKQIATRQPKEQDLEELYNVVYKDVKKDKGPKISEEYINALVEAKVNQIMYNREMEKKNRKKSEKQVTKIEEKINNIEKTNEKLVRKLVPAFENGRQIYREKYFKEFQ